MAALEICEVSHWFGTNRILNKINLRIDAGQIVALVGPSGCGKSTLLQAILGTHPPSEGQILADGQPVQGPSRNVGIVYQNYSLYDFMTAQENVAFGLKLNETSLPYRLFGYPLYRRVRQQHLAESSQFLHRVGLGHAAARYPSEM